jgi:hypothetical protein
MHQSAPVSTQSAPSQAPVSAISTIAVMRQQQLIPATSRHQSKLDRHRSAQSAQSARLTKSAPDRQQSAQSSAVTRSAPVSTMIRAPVRSHHRARHLIRRSRRSQRSQRGKRSRRQWRSRRSRNSANQRPPIGAEAWRSQLVSAVGTNRRQTGASRARSAQSAPVARVSASRHLISAIQRQTARFSTPVGTF